MRSYKDDRLCGMDYLSEHWYHRGVDPKDGFQLIHNLGARSIRNWMHFGIFMSAPNTFKEDAVQRMHGILSEAKKHDIFVIGMAHDNWSLTEKRFCIGKPARTDSTYQEWLQTYEQCWYLLAREFPEVSYWEIDNELNNKDFMFIEGHFGEKLSTVELAAMSADMLFYGSRGIHRANPDAQTVLGGIVDPYGLGVPETDTGTTMVNFMEALYDAIESGVHGSREVEDFFQIACWHPYYYRNAPDDYFVAENNKIYEVICRREGKPKRVFWTEFGWDEAFWDIKEIPAAIEKLFPLIRKELPYVECLCYYRFFDDMCENGNRVGLFCDPTVGNNDTDPKTGVLRPAGMPKTSAYAYQAAAGGSGPLTIVQKEG